MVASHVFPQSVLAVIPLIGGVIGVQSLHWMLGGDFSLLHGCHSPDRDGVCSPVVGVEARRIGFSQVLLPLSMCPDPKEVTTEACEACVVTANLRVTCACICGSAQKQPSLVPFSIVLVLDLVPDYGVEWSGLGVRAWWLQESRWLCCRLGPGLPLMPSPRTCAPQTRLQAVAWCGRSQSSPVR